MVLQLEGIAPDALEHEPQEAVMESRQERLRVILVGVVGFWV